MTADRELEIREAFARLGIDVDAVPPSPVAPVEPEVEELPGTARARFTLSNTSDPFPSE